MKVRECDDGEVVVRKNKCKVRIWVRIRQD